LIVLTNEPVEADANFMWNNFYFNNCEHDEDAMQINRSQSWTVEVHVYRRNCRTHLCSYTWARRP